MINHLPPIRFSSTIRVVPPQDFDTKFDFETMADKNQLPQELTHRGLVSMAKAAASFLSFDCNLVGMTNGSHVTLAHLEPTHYALFRHQKAGKMDPEEIITALARDFARLKAENPNVRAFIAGGNNWQDSRLLRKLLQETFEEWGVPVSMICQQEDSYTNIHYDTASDTWTVSARREKNRDKASTPAKLQANYHKLHIDPGDKLIIGGKEIDPTEVNNI